MAVGALSQASWGKHWIIGHGHSLDVVEEIEFYGPRATIIVGVAYIDECLTDALSAKSAVQEPKFLARCWGDRGSIRDFSVKADLGVCFGLYGVVTHNDLLSLRDMRNAAAHKAKAITFASAKIKGSCRDLKLPNWQAERRGFEKPLDARERFIATVALLTSFLMLWTNILQSSEGRKRPSMGLP